MREDWRYEELREKMVAELPPRRHDEEEDPRIARLRVALRRGECFDTDTWSGDCGVLVDLVDEAIELDRQEREFLEDLEAQAPLRRRYRSKWTFAAARREREE